MCRPNSLRLDADGRDEIAPALAILAEEGRHLRGRDIEHLIALVDQAGADIRAPS